MKTKGIDLCDEAFIRLKNGTALNPKFKGIAPSDITPSVVSIEAGFDKGYLKSSREHHRFLIAKIRDYIGNQQKESKQKIALNRESKRRGEVERTLSETKLKLEIALTDNLRLTLRVQQLESELKAFSSIKNINGT